MGDSDPMPKAMDLSFMGRAIQRVTNAKYVTIGLALTFFALAIIGGAVILIVDKEDFPTFGSGAWWALQTVTTVGYGDNVPTTGVGKVVGAIVMVLGVSFIAFLTAGVTSVVLERAAAPAQKAERAERERELQTIVGGLAQIREAIAGLEKRLDDISGQPGAESR